MASLPSTAYSTLTFPLLWVVTLVGTQQLKEGLTNVEEQDMVLEESCSFACSSLPKIKKSTTQNLDYFMIRGGGGPDFHSKMQMTEIWP